MVPILWGEKMTDYLTPAEIKGWVHDLGTFGDQGQYEREAATLRELLAIVEAVATSSTLKDDLSVEWIFRARKVMGYDQH